MKPLLVSTYDMTGGAARAAFRLHKGLQSIGVDSRMLVYSKASDDPGVITSVSRAKILLPHVHLIIDSLPMRFYPKREPVIFSPAFSPDRVSTAIDKLPHDLVHLHWIAEGFRIESLKKFRKPVIWTLHDMWPFTGGCHYDNGCGKYKASCGDCPQLRSQKEKDLSRRVWERKKKAWEDIDMTVVSPSRWLAECAKSSSLFRDKRIEVIPNGIDTGSFKPADKKFARERWNLPYDKKLILFGSMKPTDDKRKGFQLLQAALKKMAGDSMSEKTELVIFGSSTPSNPPDFGLRSRYVGQLSDDVSLSLLYAAADAFVLPTIQDNLPNTIMEAIASGAPVISFDIGGIPDMVEHRINGYLAKAFDTEDLYIGIKWVLEDDERRSSMVSAARAKAVSEYKLEDKAGQYLELYREITRKPA